MNAITPQAKQVKGFAGFMDAIGNRHSSRSCAWAASYGQTAPWQDMVAFPSGMYRSRVGFLRQASLHYLVAANRELRNKPPM